MRINLGDKAKDKITGFEGIVTGTCQYISGCSQVLLVPPSEGGDFKDSHWFDEDRCEITEVGVFPKAMVSSDARPGPDKEAPKR